MDPLTVLGNAMALGEGARGALIRAHDIAKSALRC
jgi:hypothetical protein